MSTAGARPRRSRAVIALAAVASVLLLVQCGTADRRTPQTVRSVQITPVASAERPPARPDVSPNSDEKADQITKDGNPKASQPPEDPAEAWISGKRRYKPLGDDFPQIIQGDEYAPIDAIKVLYGALAGNSSSAGTIGDGEQFEVVADGARIVITSRTGSTTVLLKDDSVVIAGKLYKEGSTVTLFRTLGRLLVDLPKDFPAIGVRGLKLATRAYSSTVRLAFNYSPLVVELQGFDNGSRDPERLYVLDLVWEKESLFVGSRVGVFCRIAA